VLKDDGDKLAEHDIKPKLSMTTNSNPRLEDKLQTLDLLLSTPTALLN
jgi:hypothetical protein